MPIDILTLEQLQAASARADFTVVDEDPGIVTMEFRTIDGLLHHVTDFFAELRDGGFQIPTLHFNGARAIPAPPIRMRQYLPESERGATSKDVVFDVCGASVDGGLVLSIGGQTWWLAQGASRLDYDRNMPCEAASAFAGDSARKFLARIESEAIGEAARQGKPSDAAPRI